jgi:hypothetical protein
MDAVTDLPIYLPIESTPLLLQHLTRVVSRFD